MTSVELLRHNDDQKTIVFGPLCLLNYLAANPSVCDLVLDHFWIGCSFIPIFGMTLSVTNILVPTLWNLPGMGGSRWSFCFSSNETP
mmetsp:Transcript_70832/g.139087  ORF Transcript_70832/g.139087 Transcript_70832/m.139087 type:complete len:87 (+) Transcript_70832:276-536(+)